MLAVARAAGETAPLLFTALGSRLVNVGDFSKPMDALPLFIYVNARQPFELQNQQAWGAAFLLLLFVLTVNVLVRFRTAGRRAAMRDPDPMTTELRPQPAADASTSRRWPRCRSASWRRPPPCPRQSARCRCGDVGSDRDRAPQRLLRRLPRDPGHLAHGQATCDHSDHRSVRLWQEHVPSDPQPDARADARDAGRRLGPARRRGHLRTVESIPSRCAASSAWSSSGRTRSPRCRSTTTSWPDSG